MAMTERQIAKYAQSVAEGVAFFERRVTGMDLLAHEIDGPAVLATLRRDIDAGYRTAHAGWNGYL